MKYIESIFDISYLIIIFTLGFKMLKSSPKTSTFHLFGFMALTLGFGDTFHLVPRLCNYWLEGDYTKAMNLGGFVTAITMTFFYVILYRIWCKYYQVTDTKLSNIIVYTLTSIRIIICLFPQNHWAGPDKPYVWNVARNIPFTLLGIYLIVLFYKKAKEKKDLVFRYMWLAITLSFAFYAPVFLLSQIAPGLGALMMPKTCAYIWITWMGYQGIKVEKASGANNSLSASSF